VATIGFIALFGMHSQPELITTKIGASHSAILAMLVFMFFIASLQ
jgi:hypothetical protein